MEEQAAGDAGIGQAQPSLDTGVPQVQISPLHGDAVRLEPGQIRAVEPGDVQLGPVQLGFVLEPALLQAQNAARLGEDQSQPSRDARTDEVDHWGFARPAVGATEQQGTDDDGAHRAFHTPTGAPSRTVLRVGGGPQVHRAAFGEGVPQAAFRRCQLVEGQHLGNSSDPHAFTQCAVGPTPRAGHRGRRATSDERRAMGGSSPSHPHTPRKALPTSGTPSPVSGTAGRPRGACDLSRELPAPMA